MRYEETQCERDDIHYAGNLEMRHKISRKVKGGGGFGKLYKVQQYLFLIAVYSLVLVRAPMAQQTMQAANMNKTEMTFQSYAAGGTEFQKFQILIKNKIDKDFSDISQLLGFLKNKF